MGGNDSALLQDLARRVRDSEQREIERAQWRGATEQTLSDFADALDEVNNRIPSQRRSTGISTGSGFGGGVVFHFVQGLFEWLKAQAGGN